MGGGQGLSSRALGCEVGPDAELASRPLGISFSICQIRLQQEDTPHGVT